MTGGGAHRRPGGARKEPFPMSDHHEEDEGDGIFKIPESSSGVDPTIDRSDADAHARCPVPPLPDGRGTNDHRRRGMRMIDATCGTTNLSQSSISSSVVELSRVPPPLIPHHRRRGGVVQPGAYRHGGIDDAAEGDIDAVMHDEGDDPDDARRRHFHRRGPDDPDMVSLLNLSGVYFSDETIVSAVLVEDDDVEAPSNARRSNSSNHHRSSSAVIEPLEATMLVQAVVLDDDERRRCFRRLRAILRFCVPAAVLLGVAFFLVTRRLGVMPVLTFESTRKRTAFVGEPPPSPSTTTAGSPPPPQHAPVVGTVADESFHHDDDDDAVAVAEGMTNEPSERLDDRTGSEPEDIVDELSSKEEGTDETPEESVGVNLPTNVEKVRDVGKEDAQETHVIIKAPTRRHSYHVLNWGSGTYCDSFDKGNITVSCGGNGVIDEWEHLSGHCESVDAHSLRCMHEEGSRYESNSTVLFSCTGSSDEDLRATAHHHPSNMSDCRVVAGPLLAPKVTGASTNYLSLGRFCHDGGTTAGGLSLRDNHQCHGGNIKSIYVNNETVDRENLSNFQNIDPADYLAVDVGVSDENWQTFCYGEASCELPFRACGADLPTFSVVQEDPEPSSCNFGGNGNGNGGHHHHDAAQRPGFERLRATIVLERRQRMGAFFIYDFWSSSYHRIWT